MQGFFSFLDSNLFSLFSFILTTVGLWFIFKKLKVNPRWALVPFVRYYKLAVSARREDQGKGILISKVLFFIVEYSYVLMRAIQHKSEDVLDIYGIVYLALILSFGVSQFVYSIRVYTGLCEVFGRRKIWALLWIVAEFIPAMLWGLVPSFQPQAEADDTLEGLDGISGKSLKGAEGVLSVQIHARTVTDFFKKKTLLKDINLTINPGTMVLLLGGSGAGKTTFVNAITGYEKADATITLGKKNIYRDFSSMMYDIGFVPQMDLIRYNDTVIRTIEDAALLKLPRSVGKNERTKKIDDTLEIFGLNAVKNNLVSKLSGGQKKRTSIATEFVADPSLFILDEPDSGLDGVLARDLMERLRAISRKGKIVIVITHSPDRVIDLFDQVIILGKDENKTGRLVYNGSVDGARKFFERETMEDIIKMINRRDEGGEGRTDELIKKFENERREENA